MDEYKNISQYEIEDKLTGQNFKVNRIISIALLAGPFLFFLVVVYFYFEKEIGIPEKHSIELMEIMVLIFLVMAVSVYSMVIVFPKIFLRKENVIKHLSSTYVQKKDQNDAHIIKLIGVDRTLMIVRLAMMEGVTLFGFVILMLSISNSVIYYNDIYWLLTLPWVVQVIFTINNYFHKGKVVERIYNEILSVVYK